MKLYARPIDKTKSLNNVNPNTIAKTITSCSGSPPDFIKPLKNAIMIKCKNDKQYRKLKELEMIGNIPITVQEELFHPRGVISGIPVGMTESEIHQELKRQNVIHVKRIMRKTPKQTNQEGTVEPQTHLTPTRSILLTFESNNLPQEINLCYQKFQVKPYIPPVIRCW